MADYLLRQQAPLTAEQWATLERAIVEAAQRTLTGRRFIPLDGPLGAGVQAVPADVLGPAGEAGVDLLGAEEARLVQLQARRFLPVPLLYRDFRIHWRDLESGRHGIALSTAGAAAAAVDVALAEDRLVFHGHAGLGLAGLLTIEGRTVLPLSDWAQMGAAFADAVAAIERLTEHGFAGPYALAVGPQRYAAMHRVYENTGVLEIEQVSRLMNAGVYRTPVLPPNRAVVVSVGAENIDLALAHDFALAFLESRGMNHYFRVFEAVVLRVKRPQAIVALEA